MKQITWPTAAILIASLAAITIVYLAGPKLGVPAESHTAVVAAVGAIGTTLLALAKALLGQDADNDGIPDLLDEVTKP